MLTSTGGHCYFFGVECDSIEDIKRAVRSQVKAGADYIKVMATGGGLTPNTNPREAQFNREEMIALVQDAQRIGKRVAAHCHGTPGIKNAIDAEVTTIEHCSFMVPQGVEYEQPVADAIAEKGIYVCPTIGVGERFRQYADREGIELPAGMAQTRPKRIENFRRLLDSGVKFVSGNDAGMTFTGFDDFQLDLEMLVEYVGHVKRRGDRDRYRPGRRGDRQRRVRYPPARPPGRHPGCPRRRAPGHRRAARSAHREEIRQDDGE